MQLNEFIKTVLVEIAEGINEANESLKEMDASVNPDGVQPFNESDATGIFGIVKKAGSVIRLAHIIEFDVAVQVSEGKEKKAGIGVLVATIGGGIQEKTDNSSASISRIKFKIPMSFPKGKTMK